MSKCPLCGSKIKKSIIKVKINGNLWNSACPNPDKYIGQIGILAGTKEIYPLGRLNRVVLENGEKLYLYRCEYDILEGVC